MANCLSPFLILVSMFGALVNRMNKIASLDIAMLFTDVVEDDLIQAQIIDLQQNQLYEQGVQSDGSPTGNYRAITIRKKEAFGDSRGIPGRTDHITGNDTGETYDSMKVVVMYNAIKITADDRNNFFPTFEPEGLGLTTESIDSLKPEITERIIEGVREKIFV